VVGKPLVVALALSLAACATADTPYGLAVDGAEPAPDGASAPRPDGGGCGDGVCNPSAGESCSSCAADCGACTSCPMGFADCDGNQANGCETNLNTVDHCGGCGQKCQAQGGSNACLLVGATYSCKPSCDATHADCDGNPANGCETDLTTAQNCGACGVACKNPHGTSTCTTQGSGWFCNPSCASGYAACGAKGDGCTTAVGNDPAHCGDCARSCSMANASARVCTSGSCTPTCSPGFSDCSRPAAPAADDGCETNGALDPGEPDNTCGGQSIDVNEGGTQTRNTNRILPAGDLDVFTVNLHEGSHVCLPLTSQSYNALVTLTASDGTPLTLGYNLNTCNNSFTSTAGAVCVNWGGTCGSTDDRTFFFQVSGQGASSCGNYTLSVRYCSEGTKCPGCP
jgi:hypothetical protein